MSIPFKLPNLRLFHFHFLIILNYVKPLIFPSLTLPLTFLSLSNFFHSLLNLIMLLILNSLTFSLIFLIIRYLLVNFFEDLFYFPIIF